MINAPFRVSLFVNNLVPLVGESVAIKMESPDLNNLFYIIDADDGDHTDSVSFTKSSEKIFDIVPFNDNTPKADRLVSISLQVSGHH